MIPGPDNFWYVTDLVISGLSLLGSLVMLYFCIRTPSPWPTSMKFILAIAISDLLFSAANIMSAFQSHEVDLMCRTEAMLRHSSWFLTIYFGACVALFTANSYSSLLKFDRQTFFVKSVVIGVGICACLVNLPLILSKNVGFKNGPIECWIAPMNGSVSLKLIVLAIYEAVPILVGSLVTLKAYLHIIKEINTLPKTVLEQIDLRVYRLLWFPLVPFLTNLLCLIDNMIDLFDHNRDPSSLYKKIAHLLIPHSIGLVNALLYVIQKKLYSNNAKEREVRSASAVSATSMEHLVSKEFEYEQEWDEETW